MKYSQVHIISAVLKELDLQMKQAGIPEEQRCLEQYQLNAVIEGVNLMLKSIERPAVRSSTGMGLKAWLASDDTGLSSKAMAHHIMGAYIDHRDRNAHPHDPSDFGRCHRFLEAVPEAREKLPKMAEVSPVWARLIGAWEELTALYLAELPTGTAPKLYERMKQLIYP